MSGYQSLYRPGHPRANKAGYVPKHVLVAEKALGRHIEVTHPVHHHDGDKRNNVNTNLVICESKAYHLLIHARMRVLHAGGDPNSEKICDECRKVLPFSQFGNRSRYADGRERVCGSCKSERDRNYYSRKRS